MLETLEDIIKSNAWPFIEAKKLLDRVTANPPLKGYVLFETGYGPSGLPHIGTFAEVARTVMVREAFKQISDLPTRLLCFSDDLDGLRKVPSDLPNQAMIQDNLGKSLTSIPDPFGQEPSYGHYMNAKLQSFLERFGFEYEFLSSTACYKSGLFDQMMIKVLEKYQQIMDLMLPTFGAERQATYSPFMPICQSTNRVLQVPIEKIDLVNHTISYLDQHGHLVSAPVTGGGCKLQWKPDFGMRWAAFGVDYEMYGKDHRPNQPIYSKICQILGGVAPLQFFYELFLSDDHSKISKSKGNGITIDQWLHYAPVESLGLFIYQSPTKAKRLHLDVIPKNVDEYLIFNQKYQLEPDRAKQLANPVHHIHCGQVPVIETFGISFGLLLNLAAVCNPDSKTMLWGFISQYAQQATPESAPYLDQLAELAVNYYNDFIKAHKTYLIPDQAQQSVLKQLLEMLANLGNDQSTEQIQTKIYAIGRAAGYENLRDYFQELYQILLGQVAGPRLGSFVKFLGIEETKNLIISKLP